MASIESLRVALQAAQEMRQIHYDIIERYNSLLLEEGHEKIILGYLDELENIANLWSDKSSKKRWEHRIAVYQNVSAFFERIFSWKQAMAPGCKIG